ncbi:MAG: hypothetical protein ACI4T5_10485 [Prevotella sp.]
MDIMSDVSKADVEATAENELPITSIITTLDNETPTYMEVATMEGMWRADGSAYLPSRVADENMPLPLWSKDLISEANPLVLTYNFDRVTSFIGITFAWDNTYDSWPTKLQLYGYAEDGTEKYAVVVTSVNEYFDVIDQAMDDVMSIKVVITQWSKPQLRARVSEVYFGVMLEITEKQIMSISETTKQSLMCDSLPTDTQTYSIKNQIYRVFSAGVGTASANKSHPLTDISRIFNSTAAKQGIATVETYYWKADGELYLPSRVVEENPDIPWMSEDANFGPDDPIEIVITYEHPVQMNTISFTWDAVTRSWPVDATVEGLDSYDNVVFSRQITAIDITTSITGIVGTIKSVHLHIREWSQPGWRARIGQYEALLVYGNNNIPSEVNNLFDPTLETGYAKYLTQRQKIHVRYGLDTYNDGTLWLPEQVRYLDSWNIPTDAIQVDFQASTRLSFLTQTYQRGIYKAEGASFYDLALSLLEHSNIIKDSVDETPWVLDDVLKTLSTTAPLPELAENALLQLIAGATGCTLGTDPINGYVVISSSIPDAAYIIGATAQQQTPGVTLDTPLRSIAVKMYNYTVESESTELFNGTVVLNDTQTVTVTYSENSCATNCEATIVGATVVSQTFYGYAAVFELEVADAGTEVSIVITGYKVTSSNVQVTTFLDAEVASGREVVIDNSLITNMGVLNVVAARAYEYYRRRSTASTSYLGYPDLKAGDRSALYSQYMNENGYITEHTFEYNGGFSGSLKMLMEV